ncbi:MAG: hypothetical protein ACK46N_03645 [Dolichospermum sp.]
MLLKGNREQGTGTREQGTGNREQGPGNREQGPGVGQLYLSLLMSVFVRSPTYYLLTLLINRWEINFRITS